MKALKICLLIATPVALAAMFGNTCYSIANGLRWIDQGVNYVPAFFALSFFAFWAFFAATAQILYPSADMPVMAQKTQVNEPLMTQPCDYKISRFHTYSNKPLFNSLNLG